MQVIKRYILVLVWNGFVSLKRINIGKKNDTFCTANKYQRILLAIGYTVPSCIWNSRFIAMGLGWPKRGGKSIFPLHRLHKSWCPYNFTAMGLGSRWGSILTAFHESQWTADGSGLRMSLSFWGIWAFVRIFLKKNKILVFHEWKEYILFSTSILFAIKFAANKSLHPPPYPSDLLTIPLLYHCQKPFVKPISALQLKLSALYASI